MATRPIEWPEFVRGLGRDEPRPTSPLRTEKTAAVLGLALGVCFTICFATGLYSHWAQSTDPIIAYPARPAGLYRVTQATHVFTGVATIPLLFAKLWTVLPKFFRVPPVASVPHALERLALFPLVGGAIFLLFTGLNNVAAWYPWDFSFRPGHYWAAWVTMGGLVVHIGAKLATTTRALRDRDPEPPREDGGLGRRGFLALAGGLAAFLAASLEAQSITPFRPIGWLSPRDLSKGPQGFPVNSSARFRGVVDAAMAPDYRLRVTGDVTRELSLSLDDLRGMVRHEAELPIACVEGWSKSARWGGVRLRDLMFMAGAREGAACTVVSLQEGGGFRTSFVNPAHASDRDTLLALEINGEVLHIDHGFPVRLIGPNRPGVNQTKWVSEVRVS